MKWVLHAGDNRDALRAVSDNSVDSCVTDPPYALVSIVKRFGGANTAPARGNDAYMRASAGFMGKTWDTGECAMSVEFWAEVLRVLKPGAHLVAFGATRGYHRMACAIEDAGFEIRDSLAWLYGTGFPKSHDVSLAIDKAAGVEGSKGAPRLLPNGREYRFNIGFENGEGYDSEKAARFEYIPASDAARAWGGWGTALKPAFEPIVLARKPLSESTVAANVLRWGTGAINIDGCRIEAGRLTEWGGGAAGGNKWNETNNGLGKSGEARPVEGRFPANVVHDGSDEVAGAFPVTSSGTGAVKRSTGTGYQANAYGKESRAVGTPNVEYGDSGSAARFFYSAKASKADRAGSKHPTVKPVALMAWLCRLITPAGGVVLDPFAGSGTTGAAALAEGFSVILCEREAEYVADIQRRLGSPEIRMPWDSPFPWS